MNRFNRKRKLPLICGFCTREQVFAVYRADRVLVWCEGCGRRIFSYYVDPELQRQNTPPESEDRLFIRQVERDLLQHVSRAAGALYEYLRRYTNRHGYAPTLREIQSEFGWRSANTATHHLKQLELAGLIERDYGETRGIRLPHAA